MGHITGTHLNIFLTCVQLIFTTAGTAGAETRLSQKTLPNQEGVIDLGCESDLKYNFISE